jgi:uncharacterized protein YgfB (UPF0149 family)
MTINQLSFEELEILSEFLALHDNPCEPSEIQGLCLGIICTGRQQGPEYWYTQIEKTLLGEEVSHLPSDYAQLLQTLLKTCFQALTHPHFELALLLPDDTMPMEVRLKAISDWSKGFIYGLGLGSPEPAVWSQPNIKEALEDIAQIQAIDTQPVENDDSEKDYIELVEYLKIAAILIFEECSESLILQGQSNHGLH